jgi:hypothetical protein
MALFLLGLFSRPKNQSTSLQEDMSDFVTNISQSFISNNSSTVGSNTSQINSITINHIKSNGCSIDINQAQTNNTTLTAELTTNMQSQLASNLVAALSSNITAVAGQTSNWFSAGNKSDATERIVKNITANISSNLISKTYNKIFNTIHQDNTIVIDTLELTCTPGHNYTDLEISQKAVVFVVADAITTAVVKQLQNNSEAWSALDYMRTELQQKQNGLFGGKFVYIAIAIAVIMVVALIIFLYIKYGGNSKTKRGK